VNGRGLEGNGNGRSVAQTQILSGGYVDVSDHDESAVQDHFIKKA
jgi:hypothetical protein